VNSNKINEERMIVVVVIIVYKFIVVASLTMITKVVV